MHITPGAIASSGSGGTTSTNITQVGGVSFSLGQQLAALSLPVVLTAAQITTLTPPSAITNYALESGGNLATLAGVVSSSRAAVNLISGQVGVAGGSGVTGATVQRVVLATDVALPTGSNVIGHVITDTGSTTAVTGTVTVDTELPAAAIAADGATNPTAPFVQSANSVFNGTTWDRLLEAANALNSTGTGLPTAQIVGQFDDTSPGTVTENRFGNIRMSVRREMYVQLRDAAGNERGLNIDANGGIPITIESAQTLGTVTTVATVTNLAQMNGAAITMGNGISGTGVQRVTIASDSTGVVGLAAGSQTIGALTANQSVNNAQIAGNTVSTSVGATGTGTQRVVVANGTGRTLVSTGGSASSSGNNTLVSAGTNRLKIYAFSLSTVSTTAVTCIFQDGASGTELWRVILQTPASVAGGANLVVQPPAWIFATSAATLLNLNLSAAVAVNWSVAYYDEA